MRFALNRVSAVLFTVLVKISSRPFFAVSRGLTPGKLHPVRVGAIALCALCGVRYAAAATVSPATVTWAAVAIGNKGGQKVVTLTNGNATAITISSLTLSGANPGDFSIFSKTCGSTLAPSASCTANIIFGPTATGTRAATLNFNDSDNNSPQTNRGAERPRRKRCRCCKCYGPNFSEHNGWIQQRVAVSIAHEWP
jgi:hypothetical protein